MKEFINLVCPMIFKTLRRFEEIGEIGENARRIDVSSIWLV
jgi:hypothetical protein